MVKRITDYDDTAYLVTFIAKEREESKEVKQVYIVKRFSGLLRSISEHYCGIIQHLTIEILGNEVYREKKDD